MDSFIYLSHGNNSSHINELINITGQIHPTLQQIWDKSREAADKIVTIREHEGTSSKKKGEPSISVRNITITPAPEKQKSIVSQLRRNSMASLPIMVVKGLSRPGAAQVLVTPHPVSFARIRIQLAYVPSIPGSKPGFLPFNTSSNKNHVLLVLTYSMRVIVRLASFAV